MIFSKTNVIFVFIFILINLTQSLNAQVNDFTEVTDSILNNPDSEDWLRWRGNHKANGYSPLDQINTENVQDLQLAWAWNLNDGETEQEPIVYNGIMYLPHSGGKVQALDASNGDLIWEYQRRLPRGMNGTTRGLAIYQDKILVTTDDAFLVALDAITGEMIWEIKTGVPEERVNYSSPPIAGDGKVFAGQTCGTGTPHACALIAHDAETGKELWRRSSVAGPNDPPEHFDTWGGVPYEGRKKASFWLAGSYDPELKLVYWSTASPYPYPGILKGTGTGNLLYTNSILALEADTGKIRWFFQMQPRDNFDMDHQDNPILADVVIGGSLRKVIYLLGKPGILWAFDRETGEHLWNRQLVEYQNLYGGIDPETGEITLNESIIPQQVGDSQLVCPGMRGGKLFQTNAFNPKTGIVYSPISNSCTEFKVVSLEMSVSGLDYGGLFPMQGTDGQVGRLAAVSASTGNVIWNLDQRAALGSVLTTGGNLVFYGDLHRYFRAIDAESGEKLWEIPLGSPVTGYPISYAANGKQYVAIAIGGSSAGTRHFATLYPELNVQYGSSMLMVFALPD
jgi:alcohol dehydrogenase (cytochrome c)